MCVLTVAAAAAFELPANLSKCLYGRRCGNTCYGPDGICTLQGRGGGGAAVVPTVAQFASLRPLVSGGEIFAVKSKEDVHTDRSSVAKGTVTCDSGRESRRVSMPDRTERPYDERPACDPVFGKTQILGRAEASCHGCENPFFW